MARHHPSPLDSDEEGEYVPDLRERIPDLLANEFGGNPEDYRVDDIPMPDPFEDKPAESDE